MKITHTIWEGDPAILYTLPSGRMEVYLLTADGWIEAHPADVACKAGMVTKAMFDDIVADGPGRRLPLAAIESPRRPETQQIRRIRF